MLEHISPHLSHKPAAVTILKTQIQLKLQLLSVNVRMFFLEHQTKGPVLDAHVSQELSYYKI